MNESLDIPCPPPPPPSFDAPGVMVAKAEVVSNAKNRLSEYVDAEVARIRSKYESARQDLAAREAREIASFLESTCERVKTVHEKPVAPAESSSKSRGGGFFGIY